MKSVSTSVNAELHTFINHDEAKAAVRKPTVRCALLAALLARHGWGSPIGEDQLLAIAALEPGEYPDARRAFAELRTAPYIVSRGKRGIELDTGAFGRLADVLHHDCEWEPFEIRLRLKHYEGWDQHDWA